jgi:hypothetical protein
MPNIMKKGSTTQVNNNLCTFTMTVNNHLNRPLKWSTMIPWIQLLINVAYRTVNPIGKADRHMDEIYRDLKDAVIDFISQQSDASLKFDIQMLVEQYFEEEVSRYTPEELARIADTPEKIIQHFKKYLAAQEKA